MHELAPIGSHLVEVANQRTLSANDEHVFAATNATRHGSDALKTENRSNLSLREPTDHRYGYRVTAGCRVRSAAREGARVRDPRLRPSLTSFLVAVVARVPSEYPHPRHVQTPSRLPACRFVSLGRATWSGIFDGLSALGGSYRLDHTPERHGAIGITCKHLGRTPRPSTGTSLEHLIVSDSFPSGHTAAAVASASRASIAACTTRLMHCRAR